MLFSVIIPVFNTEKYLEKCLDSVLQQSYENWQAIIVDDGSSDSSGAIADTYSARDKRFLVIHKNNEGQLKARLDGICASTGDVIMFLDSDDWWESCCLEKIEKVFENNYADIVFFPGRVVGEQGNVIRIIGRVAKESGRIDKERIYESMISSHDFNSLWLKAFRNTLFDMETLNLVAEKRVKLAEDKLMLLPLITNARKIYYLEDVLYTYRHHRKSISHKYLVSDIPDMIACPVFAEVYKYMVLWKMDNEYNRRRLELYYLRNLLSCYCSVRHSCSDKESKKMFRKYPWKETYPNKLGGYLLSTDLTIKEKIKLLMMQMPI